MFNQIELHYWLISKAAKLPADIFIQKLDSEVDFTLLSLDEIQQTLRLFKLFGRYDLMLVLSSATQQPTHPNTVTQLSLQTLKQLYATIQSTTQLILRVDFSKWPRATNDLVSKRSLNIMTPEFRAVFKDSLCKRLPHSQSLEHLMLDHVLPTQQTRIDLLSEHSDTVYLDSLFNVKGMDEQTRRGFLLNSHVQKNAWKLTNKRKLDKKLGMELLHNPITDRLAFTSGNFAKAYKSGWEPGLLFAFYLEYFPLQAQKLLASLPPMVQADLIEFTHLTYGIATEHLLGNIVRNQSIIAHLSATQQSALAQSIALTKGPQTAKEIPDKILAEIMDYSADEVQQQLIELLHPIHRHWVHFFVPNTKQTAEHIDHLMTALYQETDALMRGIRNTHHLTQIRKYFLILSLCVMSLIASNLTWILLSLKHHSDLEVAIVNVIGGLLLFANLGFMYYVGHKIENTYNQLPYVDEATLTSQSVQTDQSTLLESAQLTKQLLDYFSKQDFYRHHFELVTDTKYKLLAIIAVCEFIRDYNPGDPINQLVCQLESTPFMSKRDPFIPAYSRQGQLSDIAHFFTTLSQRSLRELGDQDVLISALTQHAGNHPVQPPKPSFWQSCGQRQSHAVDDQDRMYLLA